MSTAFLCILWWSRSVGWHRTALLLVLRQAYLFRGVRVVIVTATASDRFSEEHEQSLRQLIRSFRSTREQFANSDADGSASNGSAPVAAARDGYSGQQPYRLHRALEFCRQVVWFATGGNLTPEEMERIAAGSRAYDPDDGTIHSEISDILSIAGVPAHCEPGTPWNIQRALHHRIGIDDFHLGRPTRFAGEMIYRVLDVAYSCRQQLVVASQVDVTKLENLWDGATAQLS